MALGVVTGWFKTEVMQNRLVIEGGKKKVPSYTQAMVELVATECNHAFETLYNEAVRYEFEKMKGPFGSGFAAPVIVLWPCAPRRQSGSFGPSLGENV